MVIVIFLYIFGITVVITMVAIVHDLIVGKWKLANFVAVATPARASGSGSRILQTVKVAFDAEYRHLFFGRIFGKIQPSAYAITLQLDPNIVRCEQSIPQYCPTVTGGVATRYRHIEHSFVIQWDAFGTHELPIDVTWDGAVVQKLKTQIEIVR